MLRIPLVRLTIEYSRNLFFYRRYLTVLESDDLSTPTVYCFTVIFHYCRDCYISIPSYKNSHSPRDYREIPLANRIQICAAHDTLLRSYSQDFFTTFTINQLIQCTSITDTHTITFLFISHWLEWFDWFFTQHFIIFSIRKSHIVIIFTWQEHIHFPSNT